MPRYRSYTFRVVAYRVSFVNGFVCVSTEEDRSEEEEEEEEEEMNLLVWLSCRP